MTLRKSLTIFVVALALCTPACAADLVNINTADSATLQTLNGIGPSKAQAIIDYRTQHGPFAAIEDIMNVSGIGTATYNNIKDFITVDSTQAQNSSDSSSSSSSSSQSSQSPPATTTASYGGTLPPTITAQIIADAAVVGAGTLFEAGAFGSKGEPLMGARFVWNFGDGAVAEGARVMHTYAYPGAYEVYLSAGYNYSSATARLVLDAVPAEVKLFAEGDGSLTVGNLSSTDLNIGRWVLAQGTSTFAIPEETVVLAGKGVRFGPGVLGFAGGRSAALRYPNGTQAAAAGVSVSSPLRGQVVELAPAPGTAPATPARSGEANTLPTPPRASSATHNSADQSAAVALGVSDSMWSYLLGLAAVIALGTVGTYYARVPRAPETEVTAEEFEIE